VDRRWTCSARRHHSGRGSWRSRAENALIKLYTEKERWADLVALQHARQRRMTDPSLRAESLLRLARVEEEKLGDVKSATRTLQEAVEVEPENLRALHELARLLDAQADYLSLVAVLSREVDLRKSASAPPCCFVSASSTSTSWACTRKRRKRTCACSRSTTSRAVRWRARADVRGNAIRNEDIADVATRLALTTS